MEIAFFLDHGRFTEDGRADWQRHETWPNADMVPRKGELVKVTVFADEFADVPVGATEREMRVIEVCHMGPTNVQVYLVPTSVKDLPR